MLAQETCSNVDRIGAIFEFYGKGLHEGGALRDAKYTRPNMRRAVLAARRTATKRLHDALGHLADTLAGGGRREIGNLAIQRFSNGH